MPGIQDLPEESLKKSYRLRIVGESASDRSWLERGRGPSLGAGGKNPPVLPFAKEEETSLFWRRIVDSELSERTMEGK
jgi:hypothetical protein